MNQSQNSDNFVDGEGLDSSAATAAVQLARQPDLSAINDAPAAPAGTPPPAEKTADVPIIKVSKNRRRTWLVLMIAVIILAALIIFSVFFAQPKLILQNVPAGAKILFDGQEVSPAVIKTSGGIHYLKISLAGFVALDKTIQLGYFQRVKQDASLRPLPQARQMVDQNAFTISQDLQNSIYYLDDASRTIYKISPAPAGFTVGQTVKGQIVKAAVTPTLNIDIDKVIFSPDFSLAIFRLKDGQTGLYDFSRYDLLHQEFHSWGKNIGDIVWRQDGKKVLYYQSLESGRRMLTLADKDNSNQNDLVFLDEYEIKEPLRLDWTSDQKTVLIVSQGNLYLLDIESRKISVALEGGVENGKFSPDSQNIVLSQKGSLKLLGFSRADSLGQDKDKIGAYAIRPLQDLGVAAAVDQTAFSVDSRRLLAYTADKKMVEINLPTQKVREFNYQNQGGGGLEIQSFKISPDEKTLFFLSPDKKLMSLPLDKGEY